MIRAGSKLAWSWDSDENLIVSRESCFQPAPGVQFRALVLFAIQVE